MAADAALILGWARSPVVGCGGAFQSLLPHHIAAPVVQAVLQRAGIAADAVDAIVLGNALGAGGNPARMVALAAGLPRHCASFTVDTQCCAGLDAVALARGLLASGQASIVVAGGVEAWSRAPIRAHRPLHPGEPPVPYERPAFAPDPRQDPDLLLAASRHAAQQGITRAEQDAYALQSHQRALARPDALQAELVAVHGVTRDSYPRALDARRAARMPALFSEDADVVAEQGAASAPDCSVSALGVSARADGAAMVVLATPEAAARLGLRAHLYYRAGISLGSDPAMPLLAAQQAALACLDRAGVQAGALDVVELHDAFAVQGISFCRALGIAPEQLNRHGGGLARGHPIGASGAIALVRALADLHVHAKPGGLALAAVAGAGGLGAAALIEYVHPASDIRLPSSVRGI